MSGDGIRGLATTHRLRCRRDSCGDYSILGKWGEMFCYDEGRIGVQIGGPRANGSMTAVPEGSNKRINQARRLWGEFSQCGDGEAIFVVPEDRLVEAAQMIGAYRKRQLSPEQMARLVEIGRRTRRTMAVASGSGR